MSMEFARPYALLAAAQTHAAALSVKRPPEAARSVREDESKPLLEEADDDAVPG